MSETKKQFLKTWLNLRQQHPRIYYGLTAVICFVMFFFIAWKRLDPDYGWHLVTGQYIIHHGVPKVDIYTYTAKGFTWVDHEWGNDVILAGLHYIGGYLADALFFAVIWAAAILIWAKKTKAYVVYIATLAMLPYAGIRPVAWTVLFFSLLYYWLDRPLKRSHWAVPLLFLVWANLHAGFIAGLALLGWYGLIKRNWRYFGLLAVSTVVTLINPFGIGLYKEIAHTLFDPQIHKQISEWRSFFIPPASDPYVYLWIIGFIVYARLRLKRWINLGVPLFLSALSASRNVPLFVIATLSDFDCFMVNLLHLLPPRHDKAQKALYGLIISLMLLVLFYVSFEGLQPSNSIPYPSQAVAYIKKNPCKGNLFNSYDFGGYLIWKLKGTPIYIDGRMVTWIYYMNRYESLINHPASQVPKQFKQYNIRCALLESKSTKIINYLVSTGWKRTTYTNYVYLTAPSKR